MAAASTRARPARSARGGGAWAGSARALLRERLEARREEIEATALTRVSAISDPAEVPDPAYAEGLRAAVRAAISYGIETTGREAADPPIPVALLAQARIAARARIPLDTVLRRYFAGYSLLGYFILEEAANAGIADGEELKRLLGAHAGLFDRLLEAVGEEHAREAEQAAPSTAGRRQAERIERLLAGEQIDTSEIPYDFEGWHIGVVAEGAGAEQRLRELAAEVDCRLLLVTREDETVWAWLGSLRRRDPADLLRSPAAQAVVNDASASVPPTVALGEPAERLTGWALTHRQAAAALPIAQCEPGCIARYADTAVAACVARDAVLAGYLREAFLTPLEAGSGGVATEQTLRAYFDAGRNVSAAAAALGLTRQSMRGRLATIEARIGRPLGDCATELELALRLRARPLQPDRRDAPRCDNQIAGANRLGP